MSFYGNVTNIFQFDEIYPNRAAMDAAAASGTDNIFQNRFVLVKYNQGTSDNDIAFTSSDIGSGYYYNGYMYVDAELQQPYYFTSFTRVSSPTISNWNQYYYSSDQNFYYKLPNETYFNANEHNYYVKNSTREHTVYKNQIFRKKDENGNDTFSLYICRSGTSNYPAVFEELASQSIDSKIDEYLVNYNIDAAHYGANFDVKGYDATVWQKEFVGNTNGRFRLIASLNGTTPQLELSADQPVLEPKAPYIDSSSSKNVYKIKVPTKWGMQIKEETNENLSDQQVIQTKFSYDENSGTYISTQQQVDGAIYFNKDGATPIKKQRDNNTQNEIKLEYTGKSGKLYNGEEAEDTIDVSLHFPAIGNMISDGYDLIYGVNDDENQTRPRDINWYSGDSSEQLKQNGNSFLGGKSYDLNTIAGNLNTIHQRLGQNIITLTSPITDQQAQTLDKNYIYAVQGNDETLYYRIGTGYNYTIVPEFSSVGTLSNETYEKDKYYVLLNGNYEIARNNYIEYEEGTEFFRKNINYSLVSLTENEYMENTYYIERNGEKVPATENWNYYPNNESFFIKDVSIFKFSEIELEGYYANTYYYQDANNNFRKDTQQYVPTYKSQPYYNITPENELTYTFDFSYRPNQYFTKNGTHYVLSTETVPALTNTYYDISRISVSDGAKILYQSGKYYYYDSYVNGQPVGYPKLDEVGSVTSGRVYWYIPLEETPSYFIVNGEMMLGYALDVDNKVQVSLFSPSQSLDSIYIYLNNEYIPANEIENLTVAYNYYSLTIALLTSYFLPNEYYLKDGNGNYYLQSSWSGNTSTVYYKLVNLTPIDKPFYEAGKYYYFNGNIYLIDNSLEITITNGVKRTYYIGTSLYVYEDSSNRWSKGFEWQEQAVFVPASVTLATREEISKVYEIKGINNGESSINGAILNFNEFASFSDTDTRNISTLTGAINTTKDLLQSINNNLIPGRVLYINDFGQIAVSSIKITDLQTLLGN